MDGSNAFVSLLPRLEVLAKLRWKTALVELEAIHATPFIAFASAPRARKCVGKEKVRTSRQSVTSSCRAASTYQALLCWSKVCAKRLLTTKVPS